jgi:hypothetical protein
MKHLFIIHQFLLFLIQLKYDAFIFLSWDFFTFSPIFLCVSEIFHHERVTFTLKTMLAS